jgi:hypothetical protein
MKKPIVTWRENSRKQYGNLHKQLLRKTYIVNSGSLQRIADALEEISSLLQKMMERMDLGK